MSDRFFLKSVALESFKAVCRSGSVKLTPLTVFIGNNGSGKSSMIEGLDAYRTIVLYGLDEAMNRWYGIEHIWNKRASHRRKPARDGHETYENPIVFRLSGQAGRGVFNVRLASLSLGRREQAPDRVSGSNFQSGARMTVTGPGSAKCTAMPDHRWRPTSDPTPWVSQAQRDRRLPSSIASRRSFPTNRPLHLIGRRPFVDGNSWRSSQSQWNAEPPANGGWPAYAQPRRLQLGPVSLVLGQASPSAAKLVSLSILSSGPPTFRPARNVLCRIGQAGRAGGRDESGEPDARLRCTRPVLPGG